MEQHVSQDQDFNRFIQNVKRLTGIDLALYKEAQMKRRLTSFYKKKGFSNFGDFFQGMKDDQEILNEFLDRMTINVSEFYRNLSRWQALENKIIPQLREQNPGRLKVWSAACSTGEEPYSLVILLSKFFPLSEISVLATDLDQNVIEKAKLGFYSEKSLKNLSQQQIDKFFNKANNSYQIKDEVKSCVKFKKHNLLADPFEKNFDLIVCRNVIIYFTDEAKQELSHKFSNALRSGGVLFVGSTEQIFQPQDYKFHTNETFFYTKE